MATPFKDQVNASSVGRLADALTTVPGFDRDRFVATALAGLDALELKARTRQVGTALGAALALPFAEAAPLVARAVDTVGLDGWTAWPVAEWIEAAGLDEPEVALSALAVVTRHASAEFAVRPYIERHPELAFRRLDEWSLSADEHLRRLASEGSRPRLPWGARLRSLQQDPRPVLPMLDRLRDDPSDYVRRSVANHLNDISRDHPDLAVEVARRWAAEGGTHTAWVVRHALRTLIKAGDPRALELVGVDVAAPIEASLRLSVDRVAVGEALPFEVTITSGSAVPVRVVVDYAVHHVRARGHTTPKVFKLTTRALPPGGAVTLTRTHSFRAVTTRRYYPGPHRLELLVNGRSVAAADFDLR